jgi:hypothetical protein
LIPHPPARAWVIASGFFVVWLAVMLAGSDIPPPRGFVWIPIGLALICLVMVFALPWLWRVRSARGLFAVVWRTTTIGAVVGLVLAAIFAAKGSGEPSLPPMDLADYTIWFSVVGIVGGANGILVGITSSVFRPRVRV